MPKFGKVRSRLYQSRFLVTELKAHVAFFKSTRLAHCYTAQISNCALFRTDSQMFNEFSGLLQKFVTILGTVASVIFRRAWSIGRSAENEYENKISMIQRRRNCDHRIFAGIAF